ncbi:MAG TPA: electron transfer flavoprotein subunit beta/FixA family protein [Rubrivivax sp.]|nr:electron transfer flavoprotein subunit beta/FixA family protein [Pseudomonadota bacterium]HOL37935.1 electron transfer flavoprotein subunit beta/FixA family protein [Rubrivivax sp.]HPP83223.1 electron transfer flavoprotein subunit beta/FixA family protein [Rubrivivax sp.]
MRIVVCVKEVLDPAAVNNYALAGGLKIGADGKTPEVAAIPRLINGYDEQAIEAALRLRDAGVDCRIAVVTIGADAQAMLKQCAALGADEIVAIEPGARTLDCAAVASVLHAYIQGSGGADLVLCGRQASDDDQGVVPLLLAEKLGCAVTTLARDIRCADGVVTVTRATSDGDEVVRGRLPALVTVSNELGAPRFPTAKAKMAARKMVPQVVALDALGLAAERLAAQVVLERQYVPQVQGNCEFLSGAPAEVARALAERIRAA